jgi:UDP:flavonoid glycosyltransferase YjiC (YdhE family)
LTLARRLAARGHEVAMLAPRVLREQIEAAGVVFEPYGRTPEHDEAVPERSLVRDFEHRFPPARATAMRDHLLVGLLEPVAADVLAVLDRRSVDVVAPDFALFGALLAAEKAGVRAACLMHSVLSLPLEGMPPFGTGWTPAAGWRGRARDRLGHLMFDRLFARPLLVPVNDVRRRHGLPAVPAALDVVLSADRILVLTSRSFDFPAAIPANVVYAGPQLDQPRTSWTPPWPDDDPRPLVVVGLSTTYQAHEGVLARVVDASAACRSGRWPPVAPSRSRPRRPPTSTSSPSSPTPRCSRTPTPW